MPARTATTGNQDYTGRCGLIGNGCERHRLRGGDSDQAKAQGERGYCKNSFHGFVLSKCAGMRLFRNQVDRVRADLYQWRQCR
jgi:hypothetical protein